jgi:hypothetical protein
MKPRTKLINCLTVALLTSLSATGCATNDPAMLRPAFCDHAYPIYISRNDSLTDTTAREILEHNKTGQILCDWTTIKRKAP